MRDDDTKLHNLLTNQPSNIDEDYLRFDRLMTDIEKNRTDMEIA